MSDNANMAEKVALQGKDADYEQNAIDAVIRSWVLEDPACQALALADAQVWATLHLARVTRGEDNVLLEVKPPDLTARFEHARALMEMGAEYDRLVPYVGREVRWGEHLGILSAVSKEDVDNAIVWCTFISRTAAVDNCVVRSTEISTR